MAKQSLVSAASGPESNPGANLPAVFGGSTELAVGSPVFTGTPYVSFVSVKAPAFAQLQLALPDLDDGDPVMIRPQPSKPVRLSPFRFYLIQAFQHFSVVDTQGTILRTTLDPEKAKVATQQGKYVEHIETVVLACLPDGLVPARCTFKSTKANAAHRAVEARRMAETEEWAKQGPEYKASLVCPMPWARFTTTVQLKAGTSKSTGYRYVAANGRITPSGAGDWTQLGEFFKEKENIALSEAVAEAFQSRVDDVKAKVI